MLKTFICYIHKPGVMAPELRVMESKTEVALIDAILEQLPMWPAFDSIEVYDDLNQSNLRFDMQRKGRFAPQVS